MKIINLKTDSLAARSNYTISPDLAIRIHRELLNRQEAMFGRIICHEGAVSVPVWMKRWYGDEFMIKGSTSVTRKEVCLTR